jgi:excisionase family DNA binding protein
MEKDLQSDIISTNEAAEMLGYNRDKVSKMCREGSIDGAAQDKPGSPWRIPRKSIEKLLEERNR